MNENFKSIVQRFEVAGQIEGIDPFGGGHINDTYLVRLTRDGSPCQYILQRINHTIFRDPVALMDNVIRVTEHIYRKTAEHTPTLAARQLRVIRTRDKAGCYQCPAGNYWRMYNWIEGTISYDMLDNPAQAFEAARMFGAFQKMLSDLPGGPLYETIPDFHHTPKRLEAFMEVLGKDPCNRAAQVKEEIAFVQKHADICGVLVNLQKKGQIPVRVTHNDTKINNVLFDRVTEKGVCVIDLDTVMPGLSLYDVGDMVRTATCPAAEDERDLSKVYLDLALYEPIARGFAVEAEAFYTPTEKTYLAFAGELITFEQMIRFLADYLAGDVYYKIARPEHNLDRARTQMKLIQSMHQQREQMHRITEAIWRDVSHSAEKRRSGLCASS